MSTLPANARGQANAIVAWLLLPRLVTHDRLVPATTAETVAEIVDSNASGGTYVRGWASAAQWVAKVRARIVASDLAHEDAEYLSNVVCRYSAISPQLS